MSKISVTLITLYHKQSNINEDYLFFGQCKESIVFQTCTFQKLELFPFSDGKVVRQLLRRILQVRLLVGRTSSVNSAYPSWCTHPFS
jgi:hypothetical protein